MMMMVSFIVWCFAAELLKFETLCDDPEELLWMVAYRDVLFCGTRGDASTVLEFSQSQLADRSLGPETRRRHMATRWSIQAF